MSCTIHWRPVKGDYSFKHGTDKELGTLERVVGDNTIRPEHVPMLRAMALVSSSKFWDEVADTVEAKGAIEFYGVG